MSAQEGQDVASLRIVQLEVLGYKRSCWRRIKMTCPRLGGASVSWLVRLNPCLEEKPIAPNPNNTAATQPQSLSSGLRNHLLEKCHVARTAFNVLLQFPQVSGKHADRVCEHLLQNDTSSRPQPQLLVRDGDRARRLTITRVEPASGGFISMTVEPPQG